MSLLPPADPACEAPTTYGPCGPYLAVEDLAELACPCEGLDLGTEEEPGPDRALMVKALGWASRRVFLASGQRFFGCCEASIRPCRTSCRAPFGAVLPVGFPWDAWPQNGTGWTEGLLPVWSCGCRAGDPCSCSAWDRVPIPLLPVRGVLEVQIDGDVLPTTSYAVDGGAWLLRTDGERWPSCQATELPLGEPGTWGFRYLHGLDLPPEGLPLVGGYACELAKRCRGGDCQLPEGVRVVERDGVQFGVTEPSEYRDQGLTGFGPVDDWIALLNAGHVQEPPRLYRAGASSSTPYLEP